LANLANAANQRLQAGRLQARRLIANLRNQLIAQYQKEMKPYVASAARQRGLNVVLVETYPVMYGATHVDITDDVIEAYITNRPDPVASTGTTTPTTPVDTTPAADSVSEAVIDAVK
jgi:hypothetical protein